MSEMVPKARLIREKTARKEAERVLEEKSREIFEKNQALQQLSEQLEQKVIERTAQLEKARDEALSANRLKSAFLANMSHEIRTPLTAIIGFSENIQSGILTEEETTIGIGNIIRNSRHLLTVLNEVLDISKIESGQLTIEHNRLSLVRLLDEIDSIFRGICKDRGLYFDLEIPHNLPQDIISDETRLRQILMNLLGNAVKFTESGRISLEVKFEPDNKRFHFIVRDTGIGMNPSQVSQLFKPFVQADTSITRKYGGTGLGLSISKNLAALLGGDIKVSSSAGIGSEFSLSIVCSNWFDEAENNQDWDDIKNWKPLNGKVLVVEDNEMNQLLIGQNLKAAGVNFEIENNGEDGYQAALAGNYDLILMDIQMPVMDGKEAIGILRAVGFNSPVIALTANVMPEDVAEYQRLGFNAHLAKPIERERFYGCLAKFLKESSDTVSNQSLAALDVYKDVQEQFVKELPQYQQKLELAVAEEDQKSAETVLHQLKGLCGNFDMPLLTERVLISYQTVRTESFAVTLPTIQQVIESIKSHAKNS